MAGIGDRYTMNTLTHPPVGAEARAGKSASHAAAVALIMSGPYALPFWGVVVGLGVLLPMAWQGLELSHRVGHTVAPALLVLAGGFTLRWIMVNAGQLSAIVPVATLAP